MRARPKTALAANAHATVAVTAAASLTSGDIQQRLCRAGYQVLEQPVIARTRRDGARVLSVTSPDFGGEQLRRISEPALMLTTVLAVGIAIAHARNSQLRRQILSPSPTVTWPEFQPVWDVKRWCRSGLELYVVDDDDACHQLDLLAHGLGWPRAELTIKPKARWRGYGHPCLQDLG